MTNQTMYNLRELVLLVLPKLIRQLQSFHLKLRFHSYCHK
jgi:hypothetical protein